MPFLFVCFLDLTFLYAPDSCFRFRVTISRLEFPAVGLVVIMVACIHLLRKRK